VGKGALEEVALAKAVLATLAKVVRVPVVLPLEVPPVVLQEVPPVVLQALELARQMVLILGLLAPALGLLTVPTLEELLPAIQQQLM